MYTLNITKATKKMSVSDIRNFIYRNYYKQIGFSKEDSYCSFKCSNKKDLLLLVDKLIEKAPDPRNAKQHYKSVLWKKNRKSFKQSEVFTYQPKTFENPNIVDVKSVITEHPKASHKLSKIEKVDSNNSLYSDTKKKMKEF